MAQTGKLGTVDSQLGNMQLAFAGAEDPRPLTGTKTGTLGTAVSMLGNVRLALGEEEGDGGGIINVSAENTLTLTQSAGYQAVLGRAASSELTLDQLAALTKTLNVSANSALEMADDAAVTTGVWIYEVAAESAIELTQGATAALGAIYDLSADSTLVLTDEASVVAGQWLHEVVAESTLELAQEASGGLIRELAAESVLTLDQEAIGLNAHQYDVFAWSLLELDQTAGTVNVLNRTLTSTLSLDHSLHAARPWYVSAENVLQETHQEFIPGTIEIIEVTTGLDNAASVNTVLNRAASSSLPLAQHAGYSFILPGGILVSAGSTLDLDQHAWITQLGYAINTLSLTQSATAQSGPLVGSQLELDQGTGVTVIRNRTAESELELEQAVTYVLVKHGAVELFDYAPAGLPPLQGPYPGVTSRFGLIYPADGPAADTLELRPPELGNKDRLSFDRINRESRGGTLTVFADPAWPKAQTLALSFTGLRRTEAQDLIRFIREHLGLEIKLSDWEQRLWKGVITTPDEPVIQDGKDSFSANFEFEGELLPV